ncbi:hypothetical protein PSACC_02309 [Paramicrosporidium saccamoebae]|uniref:Uncharacterized protein n=1 Tax=Paramicrosporidium saccamoebae TaxID=1246581 RepID=A0A2H9TJE5_9FUNG|nr:hypothetical protein PSACC_02309 [Paramicrosporidium saccamoebae]
MVLTEASLLSKSGHARGRMSRKRKSDPLPAGKGKKGPTTVSSSGTDPATSGEELEKIIGAIHGKHSLSPNPARPIQEKDQGAAEAYGRADAKDCQWRHRQHPAAHHQLRIPNVVLFRFPYYLGKGSLIH